MCLRPRLSSRYTKEQTLSTSSQKALRKEMKMCWGHFFPLLDRRIIRYPGYLSKKLKEEKAYNKSNAFLQQKMILTLVTSVVWGPSNHTWSHFPPALATPYPWMNTFFSRTESVGKFCFFVEQKWVNRLMIVCPHWTVDVEQKLCVKQVPWHVLNTNMFHEAIKSPTPSQHFLTCTLDYTFDFDFSRGNLNASVWNKSEVFCIVKWIGCTFWQP